MSIKLVKIPSSPNWYLRGTIRKVRVYETTGVDDKATAETIRAQREWEILQGSVFGSKATTTTLTRAAVIYLENGGETRFIKPITDYFGDTPLAKIDQEAADKCARTLYPNLAPATIVRQVYTPLTSMITAASHAGLCSPIKFKRPKMPKGRVRWITHAEADRLLKACSDALRPLVAFLLYTGARAGEALWLDWRFVDLKRAQVQFLDTKNGTDRGVPLHPALVAILANLSHREGEVFRKANGMPYAYLDEDNDLDRSAGSRIKKGFKASCKRAGIDNFTPHDCRHTWATWHYQENRDLNLLMHLGGWSSLSMVLRYAHVNVAHAAPSIEIMPTIGAKTPSRKKVRQMIDAAAKRGARSGKAAAPAKKAKRKAMA
ncbi:MAG: site-specific integrase [Rhizobiales bacterium]|nr:site-specific integrase [Hyphomicrobiales bacterium]